MSGAPKTIGLVSNGAGMWRLWSRDDGDHRDMTPAFEYILASEHARLLAERDAEIARLRDGAKVLLAKVDVIAGAIEIDPDMPVRMLYACACLGPLGDCPCLRRDRKISDIRAALGNSHE